MKAQSLFCSVPSIPEEHTADAPASSGEQSAPAMMHMQAAGGKGRPSASDMSIFGRGWWPSSRHGDGSGVSSRSNAGSGEAKMSGDADGSIVGISGKPDPMGRGAATVGAARKERESKSSSGKRVGKWCMAAGVGPSS